MIHFTIVLNIEDLLHITATMNRDEHNNYEIILYTQFVSRRMVSFYKIPLYFQCSVNLSISQFDITF